MSIFSKFTDAARDMFQGVRDFAKGVMGGSTGSLIGIVAGVGFGIAGLVVGGWIPALVLGIGLGAASGVIGGGIVNKFKGGTKDGHEMAEGAAPEGGASTSVKDSSPAPAKAVTPQLSAAAPLPTAAPATTFQSKLAAERAKPQDASLSH